MPQGDYIEEFRRRFGERPDEREKERKRRAREPHKVAVRSKELRGLKAKIFHRERFKEKIRLRKEERALKLKDAVAKKNDTGEDRLKNAIPAYLLDREDSVRAKALTNTIKQKRKEKGGKWDVPLPKVRPLPDDEVFRVIKTGKKAKQKEWKRMVTKVTFVGDGFTRRPPKYERFIRPMALRMRRANVTHPELNVTFSLEILGVKKNPSSPLYSQLGVITRGTIIEVNVSELGLVTTSGRVVWGKYAQVTNQPELDGTINAVMLV
jgi:ribosome biogenesis protein NSA2